MGSICRLIRGGLLLCAACSLLACGDKEDPVQQQRKLLTPPDQAAIQKEKQAKAALTNEEGELLPSDLVLGGFPVPRGFELKRSYDNEWYLRSLEVSAKRTASYIEKRLFTSSIVRCFGVSTRVSAAAGAGRGAFGATASASSTLAA